MWKGEGLTITASGGMEMFSRVCVLFSENKFIRFAVDTTV
jgi:hypothetical protein